ncbi:solute carrier family 35 member F5-like isoform X2 [Corticium candelabrum]|uniref:solute carrier family 35 member F5-like isoform X2 n=1 Tax=Corticium candelabrum TaxID=121492 RepID=UPI002E274F06|nr:solute carrier family 35 member F5-like isoform X2 [Corticium candelabrum]
MARRVSGMRFLTGMCLLLTADFIWGCLSLYTSVSAAFSVPHERHLFGCTLTFCFIQWIVLTFGYSKPVFVVYCCFSCLTVYLMGFCCCRSWRRMPFARHPSKTPHQAKAEASTETGSGDDAVTGSDDIRRESDCGSSLESSDKNSDDFGHLKGPPPLYQMSDPRFEPMKGRSSSSESERSGSTECYTQQTRVRFSSLKEVRFLPDEEADDAEDSRRSFGATHSVVGRLWKQKKLTVKQVMLLSFLLSFVWIPAHLLLALASARTFMWTLQVFASLSGVFVLILTAVFPANSNDYITVTKFLVVCVLVASGIVIGWSIKSSSTGATLAVAPPASTIVPWAVLTTVSSVLSSFFIVTLKKFSHSLSRIDITMFLGFTGLWCSLFCWPLLLIFYVMDVEKFELPPNVEVSIWLVVLALIGMGVSSLLWIWGSFLTSPLIGIAALLLLGPFFVSWRPVLGNGSIDCIWMVCGCFTLVLSFITVCLLHWNKNPDPILYGLKVITSWHAFNEILTVNTDMTERTPLVSDSDERT